MLFWGCTPFPDLMFSLSQQGSQVWEWPGNDIYVFVKRLQGVDYKEMLEREKKILVNRTTGLKLIEVNCEVFVSCTAS